MIGVAVSPNELDTVREFFELFKTPWEPAVAGPTYRVVVSTIGQPAGVETDLLIAYGSAESAIDRAARMKVKRTPGVQTAEWAGASFPLYRGTAGFDNGGASALRSGRWALDYRAVVEGRDCWRVGYDLFEEVRYLLTEGQPASYALTPTLDLHIALLRDLLTQSGVSFLEVTPHPPGCEFICCLTHDIDFFGIRRHLFDRTLAGFVARASVGTLADLIRRKRPLAEALRNWAALLCLPLVFLRVLPDFWRPIDDYERADGGRPSTFFVVPFRDRPGVARDGVVDRTRAVRYQASEVAGQLKAAADRGRELGVHGIDAWRDADAGRAELEQITALTGGRTAGVRMHWLYFDDQSASRLESAGFAFDSTCGYNDALGYRAGTSQVYRLPGTGGLLELPLTIMDSALFYPSHMGLNRDEALEACRPIVANARRYGGTIVINWHDRSLAPERQWGDAYRTLLDELGTTGGCFTTAAGAVDWFRWRRSIAFEMGHSSSKNRVRVSAPSASARGVVVRVFRPGLHASDALDEFQYNGTAIVEVDIPATGDGNDAQGGDTCPHTTTLIEVQPDPAQ